MAGPRRGELAAHGALAGAAVLFGATFIPVKAAVDHAAVLPFLAVRFATGAAVLAPLAARRRAAAGEWRHGLACGVPLLVGYLFQTYGLRYTTAAVSAFITYLLVVIVPLLVAVTRRRLPGAGVGAGVVLAAAGLYLLTGARPTLGTGEALTLGCAFAYAVNILAISRAVRHVDPVRLTAMQLAVVAAGAAVPGAAGGGWAMPAGAWAAALLTGVFASAAAFLLQAWGQTRVGPTRASLLLMVEPVIAAALGWATGSPLGPLGVAGAALILAGIACSELTGTVGAETQLTGVADRGEAAQRG